LCVAGGVADRCVALFGAGIDVNMMRMPLITDRVSKMSRRQRASAVVALVVGILVIVVGGRHLRGKFPETSGTVSGDREEAGTLQVEDVDKMASFECFRIAIPDGWQRVVEREGGENGALLFLRGPVVGDQHLVIAADVFPVAKGVTLSEFATQYASEWPVEKVPVDEKVQLCGQDARMLGFTNADGDNLVIFCVHKQRAYVIAMVAPSETMPEHLATFHEVLQGMQMYE